MLCSSVTANISLSSDGAGCNRQRFSHSLLVVLWLMREGFSFTTHISLSSEMATCHVM